MYKGELEKNELLSSPQKKVTNKITDIIMNSITNYFTKLTFNQVKEISKNLVEKFFHNKNRVKMKYLSSVFLIYQKKYKRKSFMKWKNNQLKKEYELLFDKINNSQYNIRSNKVNYPTKNPKNSPIIQGDFLSRQELFSKRVKENKQKNENKQEEELRLLYTFSPKVNTSSSSTRKINDRQTNHSLSPLTRVPLNRRKEDPFERLYKNNTSRSKKTILQYNSTTNIRHRNKPKTQKKKVSVDKLYQVYKEYANKKKELQKEIDKERGMTFKPKCYTSKSGYTVDANFEERNKKLLEDRNNFVFVYDYLRQCKFNEGVLGNNNKLLQNYLVQNNNDIENLVQSQRIANQMLYETNEEEELKNNNSHYD